MRQERLNTVNGTVDRAQKAIGGATRFGDAIGLKHNTAAAIAIDQNALLTVVDRLDRAREKQVKLWKELETATGAVTDFLTLTRDLQKPRFGKQFSSEWSVLGFSTTIEIPRNRARLELLMMRAIHYFEDMPELQCPQYGITIAQAKLLQDKLVAAEKAVSLQKTEVRKALLERNTALAKLRKRLSNLVKEISGLVSADDAVYLSFGLNIPASKQIPEVPENVTVIAVGETVASVRWDRAPRAEHYRVWLKEEGQGEATVIGSPKDLDITLENLAPNARHEVGVSAVNDGGESAVSELIVITVGTMQV